MSFAEELVEKAMPIWRQFLEHPFIVSLTNGTLEKKQFARYLAQDTLYLKYFSKVYAYVFIKTDDINRMRRIYKDLNVIMADESFMHIRYLQDMGSSESEALATPFTLECKNYIDFMMRTAAEGTAAEGLVCLMPCTLSYYFIARDVFEKAQKNGTLENNYYKDWILDYTSEAYESTYQSTIALCDDICSTLSQEEKERLTDIFLKSSEFELKFWNIGLC